MKILEQVMTNNLTVTRYDVTDVIKDNQSIINAVVEIATTCYGKDSSNMNNDKKYSLYKKLMSEQNDNPTEIFEFIPVVIKKHDYYGKLNNCDLCSKYLQNTTYFHKEYVNESIKSKYNELILTNLRNSKKLNYKIYDNIKSIKTLNDDFYIFKLELPLFVVQHLLRHRSLSFNQRSNRYVNNGEYFVPDGIDENKMLEMLKSKPIPYIKEWLKENNVRKELINKFPTMWEITELWVSGFSYNFEHMFGVRSGNKTMKETRDIIELMKETI